MFINIIIRYIRRIFIMDVFQLPAVPGEQLILKSICLGINGQGQTVNLLLMFDVLSLFMWFRTFYTTSTEVFGEFVQDIATFLLQKQRTPRTVYINVFHQTRSFHFPLATTTHTVRMVSMTLAPIHVPPISDMVWFKFCIGTGCDPFNQSTRMLDYLNEDTLPRLVVTWNNRTSDFTHYPPAVLLFGSTPRNHRAVDQSSPRQERDPQSELRDPYISDARAQLLESLRRAIAISSICEL